MDNPSDKIDEFSLVLKPSTISWAGVGIFTTHIISKGIMLNPDFYNIPHRKLPGKDIPQLFQNYCIAEAGDWYHCPAHFNQMEIIWYINHSFEPNVERREGGLYALRQIFAGEEIFLDYNSFLEPEEKKDAYYR